MNCKTLTQPILPSVYENSLSYMEMICEIIECIKWLYGEVDIFHTYTPKYVGDYSADVEYKPLNVVYFNGKYYMSMGNTIPGQAPGVAKVWVDVSPIPWDMFKTMIYPDMFDGDDSDKLEACIKKASEVNSGVVYINRRMTLTRNTDIGNFNSNYNKVVLTGVGSDCTINCKGYHFYSGHLTDRQNGGGVVFRDIKIYGENYCFDMNSLIRITLENCFIQNFNVVFYSTDNGYMQEIRCINTFFINTDYAIKGTTGPYSGYIQGCNFASCKVLDITNANISSFTVKECSIEGSINKAINVAGLIKNLCVENCYIEGFSPQLNTGDFVIYADLLTAGSNIFVNNNYVNIPNGAYLIDISTSNGGSNKYTINNNNSVNGTLIYVRDQGKTRVAYLEMVNNIGKMVDSGNLVSFRRFKNSAQQPLPNEEITVYTAWGGSDRLMIPYELPDRDNCDYNLVLIGAYYCESGSPIGTKIDNSLISITQNAGIIQVNATSSAISLLQNKTLRLIFKYTYK